MRRPVPTRLSAALVLAVLSTALLPAGTQAQEASERVMQLPSGGFVSVTMRAGSPDTVYGIRVVTDGAPVDVLFLNATHYDAYVRGKPFQYLLPPTRFSVIDYATGFSVPDKGTWYIVLDNTDAPMGGAAQTRHVTARLRVVVERGDGPVTLEPDASTYTLAGAITFRAPFWELGPSVGVAGLTLWMTGLAVAAWPARKRVLLWTSALAWGAFIFSYVHAGHVAIYVAVPAVFGLFVGHMASRVDGSFWEGVKAAYFSTFVGVLLGADVFSLLFRRALTSVEGVAVIGGAGLEDALFIAPAAAVAWYVASTLVFPRPISLPAARGDEPDEDSP